MPDPRKMQINLTGFLNGKGARIFMGELWAMLDSAQKSENGIPEARGRASDREAESYSYLAHCALCQRAPSPFLICKRQPVPPHGQGEISSRRAPRYLLGEICIRI